MTPVRVTITKFEREPRGFYTARISAQGETITVDNRIGPWTAPVDPHADHGSNKVTRREVQPEIAARLRARVRAAERGETQDDSDLHVTPAAPQRTFRAPEPEVKPRSVAERFAAQMAAAGKAAITEEAA